MNRRLTIRFAACVLMGVLAGPASLSATDEDGKGYPSWGTFHPWLCSSAGSWECELWDDAATPSGTTHNFCSPLTQWQNGIDVDLKCG